MEAQHDSLRQLTLVTHYGDKTSELTQLITELTQLVAQRAGEHFVPYALGQVHATLVGLETCWVDGVELNRGFWAARRERHVQDLARLVDLVGTSENLPLSVRIGGYRAEASYAFESRGAHPYVRSFQVQGDRAVFMGWPYTNAEVDESLVQLRRSFETAHVLHKYHAHRADRDNDLFLVIGKFHRPVDPCTSAELEAEAREFLASSPIELRVTRETSSLVAYVDATLPPESSRRFPVSRDALPAVLEWLHATR